MGERRLLKLRDAVCYLLPFSASPALSRALLPARRPGIRRPRSSGAGAAVKWGRRKTLAFRKRFYLSSRRRRQSFFELGSCSSFFFLRSSASSSSSQHPPLSSKSKTPPSLLRFSPASRIPAAMAVRPVETRACSRVGAWSSSAMWAVEAGDVKRRCYLLLLLDQSKKASKERGKASSGHSPSPPPHRSLPNSDLPSLPCRGIITVSLALSDAN